MIVKHKGARPKPCRDCGTTVTWAHDTDRPAEPCGKGCEPGAWVLVESSGAQHSCQRKSSPRESPADPDDRTAVWKERARGRVQGPVMPAQVGTVTVRLQPPRKRRSDAGRPRTAPQRGSQPVRPFCKHPLQPVQVARPSAVVPAQQGMRRPAPARRPSARPAPGSGRPARRSNPWAVNPILFTVFALIAVIIAAHAGVFHAHPVTPVSHTPIHCYAGGFFC